MVITEAELRAAWRNGRGSLPDFPPGSRLTPAAKDFLASLGPATGKAAAPELPASGAGTASADRLELRPTGKTRLILTAIDVDDLVAARPEAIVVHPGVTLTDIARERLRAAGIRILPYAEGPATAAVPTAVIAPSAAPAAPKEGQAKSAMPALGPAPASAAGTEADALFQAAKQAVMARLGGRADEAVVDAVLRRVIASL